MRRIRVAAIAVIDQEACDGCGACLFVCRAGCLDYSPRRNAAGLHPIRYLGQGCRGDEACVRACPRPGAVAIVRDSPAVLRPFLPEPA
ncbi:MAG TPA: 4Fe-4S dicluster domain-containing protein [Candidatus Polarisedimenticolia bacterium]|nr:4Fe-4S dicluster domain-containing protein [Candidatus Polarisedimenticolia bacterium]